MSNQNVQLLRRFFEICNTHDLGGFAEVCTDGYRHHDPQLPVTDIDGLAQYQQVLGGFFEAFPDIQIEMHDVFAAAGGVAARWTFSGTHTGALGEMPAPTRGLREGDDHRPRRPRQAGRSLGGLRLPGHVAAARRDPSARRRMSGAAPRIPDGFHATRGDMR